MPCFTDYVIIRVLINEEVCALTHDKEMHQDALQKEQQGSKSHLYQEEYT